MKKIMMTLSLMAILLVFGFAGSANAAGAGAYIGTGPGWSFPSFDGALGSMDADGGFSWEYLHVGYNFSDKMGLNLLWGQAAGSADGGVDWTNDYIDVDFRYTFPMETISPYLEAGVGRYKFEADGSHFDLESDPVLGFRLAVGGVIPISQFYIAPEFSYHWAEFDKGDAHIDGWHSGSIDDMGAGDFGLLSLKIGYLFGG